VGLGSAALASTLRPIRRAYVKTLEVLRLDRGLLRRIHAEGLTLVLNLHRVSPYESPFWPPLKPDMFSELVSFLKGEFTVTTLAALASLDRRSAAVVLSFDDGYRDFIDHAAPILEAHGVRANMNVIPECVLTGTPFWNIRLYDGLASSPAALFSELRVDGFSLPSADGSPHEKARYGARLAAYLKNRPVAERIPLWQQVETWLERVDVKHPTRMMDVEDVRSIARAHEVGVHSYSHESMAFQDDAFFREDVRKCREFFANHLNLPLKIYAFPNGSYRPAHVEHLIEGGFEHILLVDEKLARTRGRILPRLSLNASTPVELKLQALGLRARGTA
jgi:peptidoglycan/xylan/chitin deacetylase (PgdA/CDA1 family)